MLLLELEADESFLVLFARLLWFELERLELEAWELLAEREFLDKSGFDRLADGFGGFKVVEVLTEPTELLTIE